MKKFLLLFLILTSLNHSLKAQCEPTSSEELNINNVRATIFNSGLFWDIPTPLIGGGYELPIVNPNSGINPIHAFSRGAFWISAFDENEALKISMEGFGSTEYDFFPGTINSNTGQVDASACNAFNRLWEIKKMDIQNHLDNVSNGLPLQVSDIDDKILLWPAKGNVHFTDYNITEDLAPFIDLNNNGIYDPENGDYPDISGDQAIFWVLNDIGGHHWLNIGEPLGIELQILAYAYSDTNSFLNNSTFYDVKIIKKTQGEANDLYFSLYIDPDLGDYSDDYIGCDTSSNTAFTYNSSPCDALYGCAPNIPILTTTFLDKTMTSFTYISSSPTLVDDSLLRSYQLAANGWGDPFFRGGNGVSGCGVSSEPAIFLYTGNPSICEEWSEASSDPDGCTCPPLAPGDRSYIQSSGPYDLNFMESLEFTFVATGIFPDTFNGLPNIDLVLIPYIQNLFQFHFDSISIGNQYDFEYEPNSIANLDANTIKIYPNPVSDYLTIDFDEATIADVKMMDMNGRIISEISLNDNQTSHSINLSQISKGVYFLSIEIEGQILNYKLVK